MRLAETRDRNLLEHGRNGFQCFGHVDRMDVQGMAKNMVMVWKNV